MTLVLPLGSALVAPAAATADRGGPAETAKRAVLAVNTDATTYTTTDRPVVSYSWRHKRKGHRLVLQLRRKGEVAWRTVQSLPHTKKRKRGSATLAVAPVALGDYSLRIAEAVGAGSGAVSAAAAFRVFGPVPITNLIKVTQGSNAEVASGTVAIGGQPFAYTFARYLTGQGVWRSVVDLPATSCNAVGVPLASRRRDASTGGTFAMRVVTTNDAQVAANAAAPDVAAGLLTPVPLGQRLALQVASDRDVDYFGSGQAICYTPDGRLN